MAFFVGGGGGGGVWGRHLGSEIKDRSAREEVWSKGICTTLPFAQCLKKAAACGWMSRPYAEVGRVARIKHCQKKKSITDSHRR